MNKRLFGFGAILAVCGCLSGGGGTDAESMTGRVDPGSVSIPQARVKLIPSGYDPANPGAQVVRVAQTDNGGNFRFDAIPRGYYNLIAIHPTGRMAFADSLRPGESVPTVTLTAPLTWFIGLRDSTAASPDSGIVYFPGTDILVHCDGINDARVDSIPIGLRRIAAQSRAGWSLDTRISQAPDSAVIRAGPLGITITPAP